MEFESTSTTRLLNTASSNNKIYSSWFILLLSIFCEVVATILLKRNTIVTFSISAYIVSYSMYAVSFLIFPFSLRNINVDTAYGVWCGFGIVSTSLCSYFWFENNISFTKVIGLCCIFIGSITLIIDSNLMRYSKTLNVGN